MDRSVLPDVSDLSVAILGGTGEQGRGLAFRLAQAGQRVLIGSRSAERGSESAAALGAPAEGGDNASVAAAADIVIVAVPWAGHRELLTDMRPHVAGKIIVDCVNPLGFDKQGPYALTVPEGSAAQQAAALLPESRVTAAFHHVSAPLLLDPAIEALDTDVMVVGDDREAAAIVQSLVYRIPRMRGMWSGRLRNAHQVEALTANLIAINRRYKAHAGIRITDV